MRPLASALCLAALLGAAPALPASTQEPAPAPEAAARNLSPPPAEPIPLAQVAERAEEAERSARQRVAEAAPTPELANIESELEEQGAVLKERAKRTKSLVAHPGSLVALDDDLRGWEFTRDQLASARATLTSQLTALEEALDGLSHERSVWKATEAAALAAAAPASVLERIRQVRRTLGDTKRALEARRDELLALQARVAEEEKRASDALQLLTEARSSFRSLILLRDRPPLWRAATAEDRTPLLDDVRDRVGARARSFVRFFALLWERTLGHAALFALALAGTLALRRRAQAWRADDPRLEASAVVFERPLSAAFLIALLATPLFYPKAPRVVDNLVIVALAVPMVRLLPRLLEPALVPTAYALAGFAMLDQLRDVLEKRPFAERSLLLVETLAAAALLWWMLRPARLAALPSGARIPRWVGRTLRTALLLLLFSALANVAGWVHLARAVAEGVLISSYLAVILYGGARVLRTAAHALLRSDHARRLGLVRRHAPAIGDWTRRGIHFLVIAAWAWGGVVGFGLDDSLRDALAAALSAEASFGAVGVSLGDLLAFVLTLLGSFAVARVLRLVLEEDVMPRLPARRGISNAVITTVQYGVIALGFLLAVSAAGVDLNRVSLLAGALGIGVGFGLQNVVNNFVSGLILLYERPVQIGDMVEVGNVSGEVRRIGVRSSTIRTSQGAEVIVPNANLIADRVVNWTLSDRRRRIDLAVRVAYRSEPKRVIDLLEGVARAHPDVLEQPAPQALFVGFGEKSLDFELRAWTALFDTSALTKSELAIAIACGLTEAGIQIP